MTKRTKAQNAEQSDLPPELRDEPVTLQDALAESSPAQTGRQPGDEPPVTNRRTFIDHAKKRPSVETVAVGNGVAVVLNNFGNKYGMGIQVDFPDGRTPTEDELAIIKRHVKGEGEVRTGFRWGKPEHLRKLREVPNMWFKEIGEDAKGMKPVAIRLQAEGIVHRIADDLKHFYRDPQGFAAQVQQEREQEAQGHSIPD